MGVRRYRVCNSVISISIEPSDGVTVLWFVFLEETGASDQNIQISINVCKVINNKYKIGKLWQTLKQKPQINKGNIEEN